MTALETQNLSSNNIQQMHVSAATKLCTSFCDVTASVCTYNRLGNKCDVLMCPVYQFFTVPPIGRGHSL